MSLLYRKNPEDQRGKWSDIFRSLGLVISIYMVFRWILWEPFVIPSGSMEPTLLIQDYVGVKKWAYGVRVPFTETWVYGPKVPERGDIVVFKAMDQSGNFLVKRVIGLPGDQISMNDRGYLRVNGMGFGYNEVRNSETDVITYKENNGTKSYQVRYFTGMSQRPFDVTVPAGELFMMGDNRNQSADSRSWGTLPLERIVGRLQFIWMSCKESDNYSSFMCSPDNFRMERILTVVE